MTESCKDLLRRMMEVSPQRRIKMSEILVHPWVKHDYVHTLKTSSVYSVSGIGSEKGFAERRDRRRDHQGVGIVRGRPERTDGEARERGCSLQPPNVL